MIHDRFCAKHYSFSSRTSDSGEERHTDAVTTKYLTPFTQTLPHLFSGTKERLETRKCYSWSYKRVLGESNLQSEFRDNGLCGVGGVAQWQSRYLAHAMPWLQYVAHTPSNTVYNGRLLAPMSPFYFLLPPTPNTLQKVAGEKKKEAKSSLWDSVFILAKKVWENAVMMVTKKHVIYHRRSF